MDKESPNLITVLSWNVWCGGEFEPLMREAAGFKGASVICLQEVYANQKGTLPHPRGARTNLYEEFQRLYADTHIGFNFPVLSGLGNGTGAWGQALFVRHGLPFTGYGSQLVLGHPWRHRADDGTTIPRHLSHITLALPQLDLTVATFHGHWMGHGYGKGDSPERLEQAKRVREVLRTLPGKVVLVGDFNLLPGTESLRIMTEGLHDLVRRYGVTNTRSAIHYRKSVRYADYAFIEPGLEAASLEVIEAHEASDHLPLLLTLQV